MRMFYFNLFKFVCKNRCPVRVQIIDITRNFIYFCLCNLHAKSLCRRFFVRAAIVIVEKSRDITLQQWYACVPFKFWLEPFRIQYFTMRLNGISMFTNSSELLITHGGKTGYSQETIYGDIVLSVAIRISTSYQGICTAGSFPNCFCISLA